MSLKARVFTGSITNASITFDADDGVTNLSYKVTSDSSAPATILGDINIGELSPSSVTLEAGEGGTLFAPAGGALSGITLTAPIGCTINIIALR